MALDTLRHISNMSTGMAVKLDDDAAKAVIENGNWLWANYDIVSLVSGLIYRHSRGNESFSFSNLEKWLLQHTDKWSATLPELGTRTGREVLKEDGEWVGS